MAGLGRKTFSPGDVLTSSDVQGYLMDQSVMVFAGTAARASAIPSPSAGMVAYSTATALQVYNGTAWVDASTGYGVATGGSATSVTVSGVNYTLLTFTSSSTLTVTKAGLFDVWIIAGGGSGAGGTSGTFAAGAGGAGSRVQATLYLSANQTVTIGAKGAGGSGSNGANGTQSTFGALISTVGGGAGNRSTQAHGEYMNGGCGGGSGDIFTQGYTLVGNNFGYNGGLSNVTYRRAGGGGGGITGAGAAVTSTTGGAGGAGEDVSTFIGGSALFKGGGGGAAGLVGGAAGNNSAGAGGSGGAGDGTAAAANSGSGGGSGNTLGSAGGDGICYVRFKV
jgi:hypothetical protein